MIGSKVPGTCAIKSSVCASLRLPGTAWTGWCGNVSFDARVPVTYDIKNTWFTVDKVCALMMRTCEFVHTPCNLACHGDVHRYF